MDIMVFCLRCSPHHVSRLYSAMILRPPSRVQEQVLGQKFRVDAALGCSLRKAGCTDDLEDTVNYAQVYR